MPPARRAANLWLHISWDNDTTLPIDADAGTPNPVSRLRSRA
jgi:hypothetical protein